MPKDRFICIAEERFTSALSNNGSKRDYERLFIPMHQKELYDKLMGDIEYKRTSLADLLE